MATWKRSKILFGFVETASSGGTLTLTHDSVQYQIITGSLAHSIVLPNATTMGQGLAFTLINYSSAAVTVKYNDTTTFATLAAGSGALTTLTNSSTTNGVWVAKTGGSGAAGGIGSVAPGSEVTTAGRALFGGGIISGSPATAIDYFAMASLTSTSSFGSLTTGRGDGVGACSSAIRGIWMGGSNGSSLSSIDYVTIATTMAALNFGNLTAARTTIYNGFASSIRGFSPGGLEGGSMTSKIEYVTLASTGNMTAFGNLSTAKRMTASVASPVRGLIGGGNVPGDVDQSAIEAVIMDTAANSTSFGSLTARSYFSAGSNATRGIWAGGSPVATATPKSTLMDTVQIAINSTATTFGALTTGRDQLGGTANQTRAFFAGGGSISSMETVLFANLSSGAIFGNLSANRQNASACSSAHGGL